MFAFSSAPRRFSIGNGTLVGLPRKRQAVGRALLLAGVVLAMASVGCGSADPEAVVEDVVSAAESEHTDVLCGSLSSDFLDRSGGECGVRVSTMEAIASLSGNVVSSDVDDEAATVVTDDGEWSLEENDGDWQVVAMPGLELLGQGLVSGGPEDGAESNSPYNSDGSMSDCAIQGDC